ncbi:MAG: radical SAM protein, partial [Polyangiaceae bacterium]|nr:radical SAM protein [Polyangiaceae bacterium]
MTAHALPIAPPAPQLHPLPKLNILRIQRTCVHDGPGIRTVVFFRGCHMRCKWCHNPEAQAFGPPAGSAGRLVSDILEIVRRDRHYYAATHGGVTLSGGEPLLQRTASLLHLLEALHAEHIPVAIETAADAPWHAFKACLPLVDLFLVDLKTAGDDALHVRLTGRRLTQVEGNVRRLVASGAHVRFRMCVVPGHNDSHASIAAIASLLNDVERPAIELLRYYNLHEGKARRLHLAQAPLDISAAAATEALARAAEAFASLGITVLVPLSKPAGTPAPFPPRVGAIQRAIRDSGHQVCLESARLKTTFYKQHGFGAPVPIHRARALRYVLNHKQVVVHTDELLVGNFTSKRVGGNVWMEYFGTTMAIHFWRLDRQKPVSFRCSVAEKAEFYTELLPFWARHGLMSKIFPSLWELALFSARTFEKRAGFNNNLAAIAHFIANSERLLKLGTVGIADEIASKAIGCTGPQADFYEGALLALKALEEFADRYAQSLLAQSAKEPDERRRSELREMARICGRVPKNPARSFHEALQSILFLQIALCTESFENAISLGRLDQILHPYYASDVAAGRIDYERARELLACFVLKFDEIVFVNDGDSALQLGKLFESLSPVETVTVGGVDSDGNDATNDVTYMILDTCELRPIGVNMAARIHRASPPEYLERIAEVYLSGSPMPALYNDEAYIPALRNNYHAPFCHVRNYSIVGCVEPVASGEHFANTDCANVNVVLPFLQALTGDTRSLWRYGALGHADRSVLGWAHRGALRRGRTRLAALLARLRPVRPPASLDELMTRFQLRLNELVTAILADHQRIEAALARSFPTPLASCLFPGCVERGKDVYDGGATINTSGIQAVGVTDVADSLLALEEVVFRRRLYTLEQVLSAMEADFEGEEHQAIQACLLSVRKFGDDGSPDAHGWVNRVLHRYVDALNQAAHASRNGRYVAGYYGLNVNIVYGRKTPSLPSGRLRGTPLANSLCPHYGMQMVDLTSCLSAVAKVDFAGYAPNGTTLTSTIDAGL